MTFVIAAVISIWVIIWRKGIKYRAQIDRIPFATAGAVWVISKLRWARWRVHPGTWKLEHVLLRLSNA
jgi:hypothetical protein